MCGSFEGSHRVSFCWQWATSPFWVASHWEVCSCWVGMNGFVWVYLRWPCWGMQRELQEKWRRRCCKSEQRNGRKITAVFSEHNAASRMSVCFNLFLYILCDDIMQDLKDRELTGWRPACCLSRLEAKSRQERLNSCLLCLNDHLKKLNYCVD